MPITIAPDPNKPGNWIWVDQKTGQPATQPGGEGTPFTAPSDQPAPPPAATGPTTPPGPAALSLDITQIRDPQTRELVSGLIQQQSGYTTQLGAAAQAYQDAVKRMQAMSPDDANYRYAVTNVDSAMATWTAAQNNIIRGQESIANTIQKAIDSKSLEPQWQGLADKYTADAAEARQKTADAAAAAPGERALVVAQATAQAANASLANAQASNLAALQPATIANLTGQANQANASAASLMAQAGKTDVETKKALIDLGVEPRAAEATTGTLEANRAIAERNLANLPTPEQAGRITEAGIAGTQATTAQTQATTAKAQLGPTFGLQQQIDAIKQISDQMRNGAIPLGADPSSAIQNMNDSLNCYLQATIGGTTVSAASQAAQTAQENLRQQDITQRQQDTTLQGQGISGAASAFGSAISPLIGAVKDLPAGSTALGPAAASMFAPFLAAAGGGLVKPPAQVAAPALPPFMQNFTGGGGGGGQAPQTSAPVTINIGGGGAGVAPPAPAGAPAPAGGGLPSFMQGSQVGTPDFVDSLKQDTLSKIQNWTGAGSNLAGANPSANWAAG